MVETPLGKFKSNYPALALFALGFVPLIYPIYSINQLTDFVKVEPVDIRGLAQGSAEAVFVYATRGSDVPSKSGAFKLTVPFLDRDENNYKLLLIVNGRVVDQVHASREKGKKEIEVDFKSLQIEPSPFKGEVSPTPPEFE